jgi:hypothetical protein
VVPLSPTATLLPQPSPDGDTLLPLS